MPSISDELKVFAMTTQLVEHELDQVEAEYAVDLGRGHRAVIDADEAYYPQIEHAIRAEAASMAPHYEVFYSLETAIRRLLADTLEAAEGDDWWSTNRIPTTLKKEAKSRRQREIDTGVTPRSDDLINYLTFGELGEIIKTNWDQFGSIFSSVKAVERVMANLNTLRGPIGVPPLERTLVVRS